MIQRFSAAKSQKTAQIALLLNIPMMFMLISLCCFMGLVLYANFSTCDPLNPLSETGVKNPNQLLPYFVMLKFNNIIFIPGLFLSSIFCASLSSVSSALNSMSACIWRDYLMRFERFKKADTKHSSRTTKSITFVCGLGCTGMGFLIGLSDSNLIQISSTINGALQAPVIGMFFLSCMFPMTNIYGLFAGALSGFGVGFWLGLGSFIAKPKYPKLPLTADGCPSVLANSTSLMLARNTATNLEGFDKIYSLSYMWLSTVGVLTVIIIGLVVSFVTNFFVKKRVIDDSLILYKYKAALKAREN
jgi:Na+/proline symporter